MLSVNFDPELDKLLREVHDLLLMPSLPADIPEAALELYSRSELFRQQISALELVAEMHNTISATILPVESGLLLQQLTDADACLRRGIEVGFASCWPHAAVISVGKCHQGYNRPSGCCTITLIAIPSALDCRPSHGTAAAWMFTCLRPPS